MLCDTLYDFVSLMKLCEALRVSVRFCGTFWNFVRLYYALWDYMKVYDAL